MAHFDLDLNDDGTIRTILCDGEPHEQSVQLELPWSIVTTYFSVAKTSLVAMRGDKNRLSRRSSGLQSFVMSLTGIEAFTNVFFAHLARGRDLPELAERVQQHGSLVRRLTDALTIAFDEPIGGQHEVLARIQDLYQLRNQIVHPRWQPASISMRSPEGVTQFQGMTQNFQAAFEHEPFCREAYLWCLLLVARIGRACGACGWAFCFQWTGEYGVTEEHITTALGLGN